MGSGVLRGVCGFRKFWGFYSGGCTVLGTKFVMTSWKNRYIEIVNWDEFRTGVLGSLMRGIRISDPNFGIMRGVTPGLSTPKVRISSETPKFHIFGQQQGGADFGTLRDTSPLADFREGTNPVKMTGFTPYLTPPKVRNFHTQP